LASLSINFIHSKNLEMLQLKLSSIKVKEKLCIRVNIRKLNEISTII